MKASCSALTCAADSMGVNFDPLLFGYEQNYTWASQFQPTYNANSSRFEFHSILSDTWVFPKVHLRVKSFHWAVPEDTINEKNRSVNRVSWNWAHSALWKSLTECFQIWHSLSKFQKEISLFTIIGFYSVLSRLLVKMLFLRNFRGNKSKKFQKNLQPDFLHSLIKPKLKNPGRNFI